MVVSHAISGLLSNITGFENCALACKMALIDVPDDESP